VPQGGRASRGKPIVNLLPLQDGEKINAILPVKEFTEDHFVFMATQRGTVKKTSLAAFSNPRKLGIIAISLDEGDQLVGVAITSGSHQVMLFSNAGKAVRFDEGDVRPLGRDTRGVRGMTLGDDQSVISLLVADSEEWHVLTASDGGYGKRTPIAEFRHTSRGTQGVIAMDLTEKTGFKLVAASLVCVTDGLMLITTGGVLIRTSVAEIRETGRSAQGVRLINLDDGEKLSGIEKVVETEEEGAEGLGEEAGPDMTGEDA
jgi:DNA gyrase subunit A